VGERGEVTQLGPDRYEPGVILAVTGRGVSWRVRDACANSSTASVRSPVPSVDAGLVTTRVDGPTVGDKPRSAGTRVMSASTRSSRIPSRRAITDAVMTTGVTPCLPCWLVAALGQLAAVLQPLRGAVRRRILLMDAHACLAAEDVPDTEGQQAGQSHAFVLRR
jgi:hypothetical protein